ncbi:MAG: SGNH/GDSL hydrolase family protein [Planctomycetota bacterium]
MSETSATAPRGSAEKPAEKPTKTPHGHGSRRRWRRRLLLLAAATGFAVLLAEVALRVARSLLNPPIYTLDAQLGWRAAASLDRGLANEAGQTVRIVSDAAGHRIGLADASAAATQPQGGVLFLGDSFTHGTEVAFEELFTTRIHRTLPETSCTNAGVGGYSTVQEALALEAQLALCRPQLVVLAVYENDLVDNLMPYFSGLGPRPHVRLTPGPDGNPAVELVRELATESFTRFLQPAPGAWWLYRHCALYQSVHKNLFLPRRGSELAATEARERAAVPMAGQLLAMRWALQRMQQATSAATPAPAKATKLVVFMIPTREMAAGEAAPSHAAMASICADLKLPFLSLLEPMRTSGGADNYFATDIHCNAAGHRLIAAELLPFVQRHLR